MVKFTNISHKGLSSLQFLKNNENDYVVQFSAAETTINNMVTKTGMISGYRDEDLNIDGIKVTILAIILLPYSNKAIK
ncbi:unnamed protein product [Soboliphyme baturini]|uniref:Uncharacterized protein n=1 Tax=Soboliphyme baturini TaxID=241478 RepID=A0A183IQT0_9BILA|nr:unnamed protein product [Soboliphyme baturini]